jgi:hypothetical protein
MLKSNMQFLENENKFELFNKNDYFNGIRGMNLVIISHKCRLQQKTSHCPGPKKKKITLTHWTMLRQLTPKLSLDMAS